MMPTFKPGYVAKHNYMLKIEPELGKAARFGV